jgi:hypothetical protein
MSWRIGDARQDVGLARFNMLKYRAFFLVEKRIFSIGITSLNAVAPRGERTPEFSSVMFQAFLLPSGRRTG